MDLPRLIEALFDPSAYPGRPESVEFRQTHISAVFLGGPLAYKIKKPVRAGFVDYGTLARRRLEGRLNDASDAGWGIYRQAAARWEEPDEATRAVTIEIDAGGTTQRALEQALEELRRVGLSGPREAEGLLAHPRSRPRP